LREDACRNVLAAHESVHHLLIPRASALDDDVIDYGGKARIANQCKAESVSLLVAVASFAQRDDGMCPKRIEDPADRIDWESRSMWVAIQDLLRHAAHPFYTRLNQILDQHDVDGFVEGLCRRFYADEGGPGCEV
jgi:hypothetical protein